MWHDITSRKNVEGTTECLIKVSLLIKFIINIILINFERNFLYYTTKNYCPFNLATPNKKKEEDS